MFTGKTQKNKNFGIQWDQSWISKSQNWTACKPTLVVGIASPFKHKVHRGLPIRKAAFQSLETIFNRDSDHIDVLKIVDAILNSGLTDQEEENVALTLHIIAKLTQLADVDIYQSSIRLNSVCERSWCATYRNYSFFS